MSHNARELPRGWTRARIDEVGTVQLGLKKSAARDFGRNRTRYLRAANIKDGAFDLSSILEMDFTPADKARYRLASGDVLLAEASGSADQVGRAAIWRDEIADCCFQMTVIRFRPIGITPEFALLAFRHLRATGELASDSRRIGIQHLSAGRLSSLTIALPPLEEQRRIAAASATRLEVLRLAEAR